MSAYRVELLSPHHDRGAFSCGVDLLDRYLQQQAGQDQKRRVAAVYVLCVDDSHEIAGYYTLSSCSIEPTGLASTVTKRLPRYPTLPGILVGRFAIDLRYQGQGVGSHLLGEVLQRSYLLSVQIGAMAVVVDAKDDAARSFYERHGFQRFVNQPFRLYLPMKTIETGLGRTTS